MTEKTLDLSRRAEGTIGQLAAERQHEAKRQPGYGGEGKGDDRLRR